MPHTTSSGIKTTRFFIPALKVILSVLSIGYLLVSGLLHLLAGIFSGIIIGSGFNYIFVFIGITFVAFMIVVMLPLQMKWAVFFTCVLSLVLSVTRSLVNSPLFDVLVTGMSFGFIIGCNAKIYWYWLTIEGRVFYISRQTIVISAFGGILIGAAAHYQLYSSLPGDVPIHGVIIGCIAVFALLLNNLDPASQSAKT
jgi:hypothetical protein